ncbi:heterokaryon incompatibility protein-domain-containing protein [Chaetomium strumarium]|uniref:Heterokaryon incompatibility protein-domain-containing protein n=1 Tax=Chaetomium strumarium TaxID=1170767 RepID=A0AAJ0M5B3_9PEZI|nr:heterokaryon incompatibility protein-domain-containing protein [Chaetomium strumarium]
MREHGGPLSSGSGNPDKKEYVEEWPVATQFKPTRTISVGGKDPFLEEHGRHEDGEQSQPLSWPALSHCWGGNNNFILTADKLGVWKQAVSLSSMPKTFQDAVVVTGQLGLKHLWIDSLCILQDSKADWAHESDRMANVYRCSTVHLAAHTSRHSDDGFLKPRTPVEHVPLPYSSTRLGVSGTMLVRPAISSWRRSLLSGEHSVLSTRGWVLQESLLSPRTLHFGHEQMFSECPNMRLAEGDFSPTTISDPDAHDVDLSASKQFVNAMGNGTQAAVTTGQARELWYMRWYEIVTNYSQRTLGYPSDIFPALSGLAQTIGALIPGNEYMAGLFRGDVCRGLLWKPADDSKASRAHPYRAPSWSWASITAPVEFEIRPSEYSPELIPEHDLAVIGVTLRSLHDADLSEEEY